MQTKFFKNLSLIILSGMITGFVSCNSGDKTEKDNTVKKDTLDNNPLLSESTLPYQAPDFTKIKNEDFAPAFEVGMQRQMKQINDIANNSEPATFENTFVALEKSSADLDRVGNVFNLLTSANTNPTLQKVQEEVAPKLAAHDDAIYLNEKLFNRVKQIYQDREKLNLDAESKRLVEYYYQQFEKAGANLSAADKEKLKSLNGEEASLSAKFTNKLLEAANNAGLVIDDSTKLSGLPDGDKKSAAVNAKNNGKDGKWLLTLQNTTQQPALQFLDNREVRHQLFQNSWTRAEKGDSNDTRAIILRLAELRAEKAKLLGFENYAAWKLQDQMAQKPESIEKFLGQLVPASVAKAKAEAKEIQQMMDQKKAGFKLEPWDWNYYGEMVRKAKYDLDDSQINPYFEMYNVLENGVFYAATELYGITFKRRTDIPVYNDDVRVYELFNEDSSSIGLFYADFFKRDNKIGGAWMDNLVGQSKLLNTKPVIYNVCNFSKPADGQPALISFDDVTTMFHEFGHALHGFFGNQQYPSLSGTAVARDFVEFPSQFNENWAMYPKIFKNYAVHNVTKEPMPQSLVDKIKKSSTFNQGYALTELLAAAQLDMQWHSLSVDQKINNVDSFEKVALERTNLNLKEVPPRYRSSYFLHIWANGYSAGYYAYLWTEMLDHDAYAWFEKNGGLSRKNGDRFREMILSQGNTKDYNTMFKDFAGHAPEIGPMLYSRGLVKR